MHFGSFKDGRGKIAAIGLLGLLSACAPAQDEKKTPSPAASAVASAQPAFSGAQVSYLNGPAQVSAGGKTGPLKLAQIVGPGQSIHTGSATRLELSLADGSKLRVGPAADVKFAFQSGDANALFQIDKGQVWGNVRPGARKLVFQGRHSTASVLGTVYNLDVSATQTCTRVIQGKVGVHRPFAAQEMAAGAEVIGQAPARLQDASADSGLKPAADGDIVVPEHQWLQMKTNQCIIVKDKGKAHVMQFSLDELAKEEAWLAWNRDRDKELPPH